ncbi:flavodoxin [Methanocorpusculum vombati]|uniref:Flavodoxin n=1 Tax=Methanocorpusculum vombati TaxID=3002864 RepID=A0ABT4INJ8_9EURY|nr:flavodoxin [Methanocorpusculum vombati]MCZ9320054.1 flavodoxin [Methanocorpusculum sp.]MCZ0863342.1 flavodoxin [Methanocorpusculum vombati]MDE2520193.1 flavodoxin [Methanocorpusculum sp.]MDE2534878.1 flavodoxin [Methanocorpusculum sp.]MDE2545937.1 flavodoxin [Methanocorpusculum sp.]
MKNVLLLTLAVLALAAVFTAGCVSSPSEPVPETAAPTQTAVTPAAEQTVTVVPNATGGNGADRKILIAYFSRTGNTETVAHMIAEETRGTLFEIVPETPYPEEYSACTTIAQQEQNDNARPALATHVENMDEYEVIFVGYPIWWGTMPMMLFTFLEEYDFDGKTIVPFCTSGGTGLGRSVSDIRTLCPNAIVADGFTVGGSSAATAQDRVADWIAGLDL